MTSDIVRENSETAFVASTRYLDEATVMTHRLGSK
jgi:hypothetical protein